MAASPHKPPCSAEICLRPRSTTVCTVSFSFMFSLSVNSAFFLSSSWEMVDKMTSNRYIDLHELPIEQAPQLLPTRCPKVPSPNKIELLPRHKVPSSHMQLNKTSKKVKVFKSYRKCGQFSTPSSNHQPCIQ